MRKDKEWNEWRSIRKRVSVYCKQQGLTSKDVPDLQRQMVTYGVLLDITKQRANGTLLADTDAHDMNSDYLYFLIDVYIDEVKSIVDNSNIGKLQ